jgi:hypothetical protein
MMSARVERLSTGDPATQWAEEPATPFHIGLAGLLGPRRLVDEHGRPRQKQLQAARPGAGHRREARKCTPVR